MRATLVLQLVQRGKLGPTEAMRLRTDQEYYGWLKQPTDGAWERL